MPNYSEEKGAPMTNPAPDPVEEAIELLPCPFCGSAPRYTANAPGMNNHHIHCRCDAAPSVKGPTDLWVIGAWNARSKQPAPVETHYEAFKHEVLEDLQQRWGISKNLQNDLAETAERLSRAMLSAAPRPDAPDRSDIEQRIRRYAEHFNIDPESAMSALSPAEEIEGLVNILEVLGPFAKDHEDLEITVRTVDLLALLEAAHRYRKQP